MVYKVNCIINGEPVECEVRANETVLHVLRNTLALTGAKEGCGAGECGACTIIMNGKPINACLVLAPEMDGAEFETVEGLSHGAVLSPLQESFIEHMGFQCGYCTPGMLMSAEALLRENPHPAHEDIMNALGGNLCRCTGYKKILEAIEAVAEKGVYEK